VLRIEHAIGEVFGGEQGSLAEGLLAEVEKSRLAKSGRSLLLKQEIVNLAPMQGEADGLLLAVGDGLSGWLVSGDGDEGDLPWRRLRSLGGEERKVDLFDNAENGLGLEGRTVKSLLDLGGETSIEGLGVKPLDDFAVAVLNPHRWNLQTSVRPILSGRTYVWKVGAATRQPRATPWEDGERNEPCPERAEHRSMPAAPRFICR
jgi:hypothetical protein